MLENKSILIVNDDLYIVNAVKSCLEKEGFKTNIATDGRTAIQLLNETTPSLVILDLVLPEMCGQTVLKKIRKHSEIPVIILTSLEDEERIIEAFKIGADDYITYPLKPLQFIARVHALLRRTKDIDPFLPKFYSFNDDDLTINIEKCEIRKNGKLANLTQREFRLLVAMIKNPYKAFTREELIETVFENGDDVCDRVIDVHIKNLRRKIETDYRRPKYILTAHGIGYRFGAE